MGVIAIILITVCAAQSTLAQGFPGYFAAACEGYPATLSCPGGSITVQDVMWGRTQEHICDDNRENQNCRDPYVIYEIQDTCNGQETCSVDATVENLGDPCPGTDKYLEIYYTC